MTPVEYVAHERTRPLLGDRTEAPRQPAVTRAGRLDHRPVRRRDRRPSSHRPHQPAGLHRRNATSKGHPMTTTLTFTAADLKRIVKTIAPGAARDNARPFLNAVELRVSANDTTWTATDSIQLRTLTTCPDKVDGDTVTALIPAAWLLRWARTPTVRRDIARLRIDGRTASIDLDGETWTTNLTVGDYPNWESFVDAADTTVSEFAAAVNPQKLAQVLDAAAQWAGDVTPLQVEALDVSKPCRFTVDVHDRGRLRLLLMPIRMLDDKQRVRKVAA